VIVHANKMIILQERNKEHVRKKREHKQETCTAFRGQCYIEYCTGRDVE